MGKMDAKGTKLLAILGLILTTVIWGGSFVVMKNSVDRLTPSFLLALRFTLAFVSIILVFHKSLKYANRDSLRCGVILGVFLEMSYLFQTYGIKYTTPSKNAFITTTYVVIVPFLHWALSQRRPAAKHIIAAVLAIVGLGLLTLEGDKGINIGDFLTLCGGLCFAFHMVLIDRYTETHDPVFLTVLQIGTVAVCSWILTPIMDGMYAFDFAALTDLNLVLGLLFLALFCTMIAFVLQNVCQKYLSANTSSLLLSLESVFGTLFSVIVMKEILSGKMIVGCVLMFSAVILSEMTWKKKSAC